MTAEMDIQEEWKDIIGFEGRYKISNTGKIVSLKYNKTDEPKELKQEETNRGYLRVTMRKDGESKRFSVHRLVAMHFCGGYFPEAVVNHIDENSHNNNARNLEWVTQKENINSGTSLRRRSRTQSKAVEAYDMEGNFVMKFYAAMEAERHGYFNGAVIKCCRGYLPHYKGLVWKYA
ncbi:hypothetical protein G6A65_002860 [Listeria monocytogenes]|nr:hypothetical protein [Listeria monocytogenes]